MSPFVRRGDIDMGVDSEAIDRKAFPVLLVTLTYA